MTPSDSPAASSRRELRAAIYSDHAGNPPYKLTDTMALGDGNIKTITDCETKKRASDAERYILTHKQNMTTVMP